MIVAILISKFRLQKKIGTLDHFRAIGSGQPLTYASFKVVPTLVGCVDSSKSDSEGQFGKGRGAVFFPGGAVEEVGNAWSRKSHQSILPWASSCSSERGIQSRCATWISHLVFPHGTKALVDVAAALADSFVVFGSGLRADDSRQFHRTIDLAVGRGKGPKQCRRVIRFGRACHREPVTTYLR